MRRNRSLQTVGLNGNRVLNKVASAGRSECTQLHVFVLLRKLLKDASEIFRLLTYNPVQLSLKPRIPVKEAPHLNIDEVRTLLLHVKDQPYGLAIWLQLYLGLRVGELQALCWTDIDLKEGVVNIRRAYVRKEKSIRAIFPTGEMLSYEWYCRSLVRYCKELDITSIGTHGLRHSTSTLYLSHGAHRDDIRELFAHSSSSVTERYLHHHRATNLEKVASVIRIFPACSKNVPKPDSETFDKLKGEVLSS